MTGIKNFRKKTERQNRLARIIISSGGYGVIVVILAILLFLLYQVLPLSFRASIESVFDIQMTKHRSDIMLTGLDQYKEVYYLIYRDGGVYFYNIADSSLAGTDSIPLLPGEKITSVSKGALSREVFSVGTNNGRILSAEITRKQ